MPKKSNWVFALFALPFVVVLMLFWLFAGLFFWIPGVLRAGILLVAGTLGSAVLQEEDSTSFEDFKSAVWLYPNGFVLFAKTLTNPPQADAERIALKALPKPDRKAKLDKLNQERTDELFDRVGKFLLRFLVDTLTWVAMVVTVYIISGLLGKPLPSFLPQVTEVHADAPTTATSESAAPASTPVPQQTVRRRVHRIGSQPVPVAPSEAE